MSERWTRASDGLSRSQAGMRAGIMRNYAEDWRALRRPEPREPSWEPGPEPIGYVLRFCHLLIVVSAAGGLAAVAVDADRLKEPIAELARGGVARRRQDRRGRGA